MGLHLKHQSIKERYGMESDMPGASLHLAADHPLLQQAQEALTFQLEERKLHLQEQFREKVQGLKVRQVAVETK